MRTVGIEQIKAVNARKDVIMNTALHYTRKTNTYTTRRIPQTRTAFSTRKALFIAITVVAILVGIVIGNTVLSASTSSATTEHTKELYYTSVEVKEGDTLWTIAEAYMSAEFVDLNTYVDEIKEVNGMYNDTIHTGSYLIVPYYEIIQ